MGLDQVAGKVDDFKETKKQHTAEQEVFRVEQQKVDDAMTGYAQMDADVRQSLDAVREAFRGEDDRLRERERQLETERRELLSIIHGEQDKVQRVKDKLDAVKGTRYGRAAETPRQTAEAMRRRLEAMAADLGGRDSGGSGGGTGGGSADRRTGMFDAPAERTRSREALFASGAPLSTYKERLDRTPITKGRWVAVDGSGDGVRGESMFVPDDSALQRMLAAYGVKGIVYHNGIPDFTPVAAVTVEIEHMTAERQGKGNNFEQCDIEAAALWNAQGYQGRTDWLARDVKELRTKSDPKYSWHERNDRRRCDLVPTPIHDAFRHLGGVSESRKADERRSVIFDE